MDATKARQLTLQIKNKLITDNELNWLVISEFLFTSIKSAIANSQFSTAISLDERPYNHINDLNFIKEKLESLEYKVKIENVEILKNDIIRKRMIINW